MEAIGKPGEYNILLTKRSNAVLTTPEYHVKLIWTPLPFQASRHLLSLISFSINRSIDQLTIHHDGHLYHWQQRICDMHRPFHSRVNFQCCIQRLRIQGLLHLTDVRNVAGQNQSSVPHC
jgi:hypothetical protein